MAEVFPFPYTSNDADAWLQYTENCSPCVHLAIEIDGTAAGAISIIAGNGISCLTGHFGYWIGEEYWGHGFATAAARSFATHALSKLPFARLEASVFEWNPPSMRVLEKSGFIREGVLRNSIYKDGELIDSVLFARLRQD